MIVKNPAYVFGSTDPNTNDVIYLVWNIEKALVLIGPKYRNIIGIQESDDIYIIKSMYN